MVTRIWHGWTTHENANAYEALLRTEVLPDIHRIPGFRGADLLRRDLGSEIEFVTLTYFESFDAVRAFAGEDYEIAVVPERARNLLSHYDQRSTHYQAVFQIE